MVRWMSKAFSALYVSVSKVQRRVIVYAQPSAAPVSERDLHFDILRETRAHSAEWAHKGVGTSSHTRTTAFNCEPWQEETNFSGRPLKRQMKQGRVKCWLGCAAAAAAAARIDIVTLEWSQVKQMGKVTNNKCSKDLANERESDRPVNSTHSHAPRMMCAPQSGFPYTCIW
jgi:hypothetical protein